MLYVGIDPGLYGGIVAITHDSGVVLRQVMPVVEGSGRGGMKRALNHAALAQFFAWLNEQGANTVCVAVEEQTPIPNWRTKKLEPGQVLAPGEKQEKEKVSSGAASAFAQGLGFGALLQGLACAGVPHVVVAPKTWQKPYGISGLRGPIKPQAAVAAARHFPGVDLRATPRCRVPHEGLVDALLIADWLRQVKGAQE